MTLSYPIGSLAAHPARLSPGYRSTIKRTPQKPLIMMRQTLSELTGPVSSDNVWRMMISGFCGDRFSVLP